jgi:cation diffusion facilitator family transporter
MNKPIVLPNEPGHVHDLGPFAHSHSFADDGQKARARALTTVTAITLLTMVLELVVGWWTGSLALTADGWHMGTHALALGGAVLAYRLSQQAASHRAVAGGSPGFAFGGWKIEVLTAYTSGLVLMGVAAWLAWEGFDTLRHPKPVAYAEALVVAVVGLVVNLASVWLLSRGAGQGGHAGHVHGHGHTSHAGHAAHAPHAEHAGHDHGHAQKKSDHTDHTDHGDHNFSAAYIHVMADAFTSVLAIAALAGGVWFGLTWLDPAVALLGAAVIGQWAFGVLRSTAKALVDATEDPALTQRIRDLIEADSDAKVADLHVWQVGAKAWSAALSVVADAPLAAVDYRQRLSAIKTLGHVTVEVHCCVSADAGGAPASHSHSHAPF